MSDDIVRLALFLVGMSPADVEEFGSRLRESGISSEGLKAFERFSQTFYRDAVSSD